MHKNKISDIVKNYQIVSKYEIISNTENAQGSPLYTPSLLNNRTMKLLAIYSTLHIFLHNIFIEKEKYHEL